MVGLPAELEEILGELLQGDRAQYSKVLGVCESLYGDSLSEREKMRNADIVVHLDGIKERIAMGNMKKRPASEMGKYVTELVALYKNSYPEIGELQGKRGIRSTDAFLFGWKVLRFDWDSNVAYPGHYRLGYGLKDMMN